MTTKSLLLLVIAVSIQVGVAQASINHSGYCSIFEKQNGCSQVYSDPLGTQVCSCPGNPNPEPPFSGVRCGPPNHMTGDRYCCSYVNGYQRSCYMK